MKTTIQNKIKKIVDKYIKQNYKEYCLVCQSIKDQRATQKNEFASTGYDGYIAQLASIIPQTLDNLLLTGLDEEEVEYYKSKEGTEWFAREYSEFSPAIKI